jgi:hypothetical protein
MPVRCSWLFDVTTNPTNLSIASAHSGGWSESHWSPNTLPADSGYIRDWAQYRARLLPSEASIVGFRLENFSIVGNKLLPGGTAGGKFQYPGVYGGDLNLPQDAISCAGASATSTNSAKFNLRCIPDSQIVNGEFQPGSGYLSALNAFLANLVNAVWGFIGRVKSNPSAQVMGIASGGVVTLSANVGGAPGNGFLRLNRVYDTLGNPVKGTFPMTNVAGPVYTVSGLGATTVSKPSGTARLDGLSFYAYGTTSIGRACSRKIGRPFEQYRGRRSKARV